MGFVREGEAITSCIANCCVVNPWNGSVIVMVLFFVDHDVFYDCIDDGRRTHIILFIVVIFCLHQWLVSRVGRVEVVLRSTIINHDAVFHHN